MLNEKYANVMHTMFAIRQIHMIMKTESEYPKNIVILLGFQTSSRRYFASYLLNFLYYYLYILR